MSKIVLKSLSILLGAFFVFLGLLKITPKISKDLHKDLRTEYAKYTKSFPFSKTFDFKMPSKWYRRSVGGAEIFCGLILMCIPSRRIKNLANVLLVLVKTLTVYSHWAINDEFERTAPTLVFLLMLGCRLVVDWQVAKRDGEEAAEDEQQRLYLKRGGGPAAAAAAAAAANLTAASAPPILHKQKRSVAKKED